MLLLLLCVCAVALVSQVHGAFVQMGSVICKDRLCTLKPGHPDKWATAYGIYNDTLLETGWGQLDIRAGFGNEATDDDVMYAAGYLEGALTSRRIYENYLNLQYPFFLSRPNATVAFARKFLHDQDQWSREMVKKFSASDPFWRQVGHVTAQLDGIHAGYNSVVENEDQKLEFFIFQALSSSGDLSDIMTVANISNRPDWRSMSRPEVDRFLLMGSRCSAIVKVTDNLGNILMGHSTWFLYQAMMRIYKFWTFRLQDESVKVKRMSFSSYPGFLVSVDDFYIMGDTSIVMLQTTNGIYNNSLYHLIHPHTLLAWQRVRVANMAATSGQQWAQIFRKYNSGTYPNQYMLVDLKRFQPGISLEDNLLWVVEQIPGLVVARDQTPMLREGYWPSYNVPFYEPVYNISGYPAFVSTHGPDYSYQMAPRAKIFRRDHGDIHDLKTIQELLRYNDYKHDEFSEHNACYSICCRGDLVQGVPMPGGCIDTKVTEFKMVKDCSASIINGPTVGNHLPPFQWSAAFTNVSHIGLPEKYNFSFHNVHAVL